MTTQESNAAPSGRAARRVDEQDARVVAMLQEVAPRLDVEPDAEYRRAARQRLVAMAAVRTPEPVRPHALRRLLAARAVDVPAGRWRTRAAAGLAGAALTVTSLATLVALSAGAGPGDVLYGVKRGTEQTQLALAGDSRGQTLLDLARTRLEELDGLDGDADLVRSTLATMDDQTTQGASWYLARVVEDSDPAPLDRLSSWTSEQSATLDSVGAGVPPSATDDVVASQRLLGDLTERVDGLRPALDCPGGPALTGTDALGPVPGECRGEGTAPPAPTAPGAPVPGAPVPGAPASGTPAPGAPVPGGPVPGSPAPGGTPPQAGQGLTPVQPIAPGNPTGAQPAPGVPSIPSTPAGPGVPPRELDLPGGLPSLTVPSPTVPSPTVPGSTLPSSTLPRPTLPRPTGPTLPAAPPATPPSATSPPLVDAPLDVDACLDVPLLFRVGRC